MRFENRDERFRAVYDAYSGAILAYASRRTASPADAADIVAETFTVVWRRLEDVPTGQDARPWIYGVARNVLLNHHRSNRRRLRLRHRLAADVGRLVESALEIPDDSDAAAITAAFAQLSDGDRELLTLIGWDDLDRDEVARVLGVSRAVVRLRLHRARKRLAKALEAARQKRSSVPGHGPYKRRSVRLDAEEA